jgi:hypothetical protein
VTGYQLPVISILLAMLASGAAAAGFDELKVKREQVFEFTQKPAVTIQGDQVTISFTSKAYCDATVAIENAEGRIIRYLASGVLGKNAPAPFKKNSHRQVIVWDSKDDKGEYVDDKSTITVRVSLGLKPRFERTLYGHQARRTSSSAPILVAAQEGVYAYEGQGPDHLRLFDHEGDYLKTVYPFPANKLKTVKGLEWQKVPFGPEMPRKQSGMIHTLLTSGNNSTWGTRYHAAMQGSAASAMCIRNGKIILAKNRLNRLSTDGSTGGAPLLGPAVPNYIGINPNSPFYGPRENTIVPWSIALSPDLKWIYIAGYAWRFGDQRLLRDMGCLHGVIRMPFNGKGPPEVFLGKIEEKVLTNSNNMKDAGSTNDRFTCATSVACDKKGRVYVTDYMNDRVQVFSGEGKFLKSIKATRPAWLQIGPRNEELYVFSWILPNAKMTRKMMETTAPTLTHYGAFGNPKRVAEYALPLSNRFTRGRATPKERPLYSATVDVWTKPSTLWLASAEGDWEQRNLRTFAMDNGKLKPQRILGKDVEKALARQKLPMAMIQIQRLYVDPTRGRLYLAEPDSYKFFTHLIEIDPNTGATKRIDLPFQAEDVAFDNEGHIYLRTVNKVVRFHFKTWREIPWDYGEARKRVGGWGGTGKTMPSVSCLILPSVKPNWVHQGGMSISPKGSLVVSCANRKPVKYSRFDFRNKKGGAGTEVRKYAPPVYPGRVSVQEIHVWNKHGQVVHQDAIPGLGYVDGVEIDRDNNLYVMASARRMSKGNVFYNRVSSALMKFVPNKGKLLSARKDVPLALNKESQPKEEPALHDSGNIWVKGAEWYYGGVGFAGKPNAGCRCWHSRFELDAYARSFAPEVDRYSVAVLDSNGNLILRVGKYGNFDDGVPLIAAGSSSRPNSIGGDEVGLFYAAYVAVHSDKRLFIADFGNSRILSVKLGYHATETVALKEKK